MKKIYKLKNNETLLEILKIIKINFEDFQKNWFEYFGNVESEIEQDYWLAEFAKEYFENNIVDYQDILDIAKMSDDFFFDKIMDFSINEIAFNQFFENLELADEIKEWQ